MITREFCLHRLKFPPERSLDQALESEERVPRHDETRQNVSGGLDGEPDGGKFSKVRDVEECGQ